MSLLDDDILEIMFPAFTDMDRGYDEHEFYVGDVKFKTIKFETRIDTESTVYVKELDSLATVKEINGKHLKIYFREINEFLDIQKDMVTVVDNIFDDDGFCAPEDIGNVKLRSKCSKISNFIEKINPKIIKKCFGNNKIIYVSKTGVKTKPYNDDNY